MAKTRKDYETEIQRLTAENQKLRQLLKEKSDTTSTTAAMSEDELKQSLKGVSAQDLLLRIAMDHRILLQNQEKHLALEKFIAEQNNKAAQLMAQILDAL